MPRGMGPRQPRWVKSGKAPRKHPAAGIQQPAKKQSALSSQQSVRKLSAVSSQLSPKAESQTSAKVQSTSKLVAPPKGYKPTAPERVKEILKGLDERYADVTCALNHKSAWELLVATILSAQCTDARVNMVTPVIFKKYPTVQDFAALTPEQLEPDIKSTGFFRNKSKSIVGAAKKIISDFGGEVPDTMEQLLTVPGAARKTANVVLGTWFKKADGVVVDTHVHRISRRLELTKEDEPVKIEQALMKVIPRERWILFSHQVIHHGRALCVARQPKCAECPLESVCHAADKTWSTVEMHKGAL
jgi:endonuclease III